MRRRGARDQRPKGPGTTDTIVGTAMVFEKTAFVAAMLRPANEREHDLVQRGLSPGGKLLGDMAQSQLFQVCGICFLVCLLYLPLHFVISEYI